MAWRRAPQGPHYDPAPPVPNARKAPTLGPVQDLRNSVTPPVQQLGRIAKNTATSGLGRTVSNTLRRFGL